MKKFATIALGILLLVSVMTACSDQADTSLNNAENNADTAAQKWGAGPKITNYYEYQQLLEIYELRDNPNLIMNAYVMTNTGDLKCLGKVQGFGVPYGTQQSPPNAGSTAVPEPNALYPSQNTAADWVRIIGPDGKSHISMIEPNMIITDLTYHCTPF